MTWENGTGRALVLQHVAIEGPGTIEFSSAPEPTTWAMMLAGFGMLGLALRRRSPALALAKTPTISS